MEKIEKSMDFVEQSTSHVTIKHPGGVTEKVVEVLRISVGEKSPEKKDVMRNSVVDTFHSPVYEGSEISSLLKDSFEVVSKPRCEDGIVRKFSQPSLPIVIKGGSPVTYELPFFVPRVAFIPPHVTGLMSYPPPVSGKFQLNRNSDILAPLSSFENHVLHYIFGSQIVMVNEGEIGLGYTLRSDNKKEEFFNYRRVAVSIIRKRVMSAKKFKKIVYVSDIFGKALHPNFLDRQLTGEEMDACAIKVFADVIREYRNIFEGCEILDGRTINMDRYHLLDYIDQRKINEVNLKRKMSCDEKLHYGMHLFELNELRDGTVVIM